MSDRPERLQWHLDWKSLLATVLILPVLVSLGFWQLSRADEKQALLDAAQARRGQPAVDVAQLEAFPNYLPVYADGEFDSERYWLLDNRIRQGQFGYEISHFLCSVMGVSCWSNAAGWRRILRAKRFQCLIGQKARCACRVSCIALQKSLSVWAKKCRKDGLAVSSGCRKNGFTRNFPLCCLPHSC